MHPGIGCIARLCVSVAPYISVFKRETGRKRRVFVSYEHVCQIWMIAASDKSILYKNILLRVFNKYKPYIACLLILPLNTCSILPLDLQVNPKEYQLK